MELRTKLKFCAGISLIALVCKIVVFVSPGWVVVHQEIEVQPKDYILPQDDGLHADDPLEKMPALKHRYSISFGIWYYKVCMRTKDRDDDHDSSSSEENSKEDSGEDKHHHKRHHKRHHHHKCFHRCYRHKHNKEDHPTDMVFDDDKSDDTHHDKKSSERDIPIEFEPARDFITTAVEFAHHGRRAIACYATIGVVLGLIGMIGAIVYTRTGGMGKHSGRLACSTQVLSSFFYWLTVISIASFVIQLLVVRDRGLMDGEITKETNFCVPWCLVLGGIGALLMDIAALFHMILISRDRRCDGTNYSFKVESGKTPIISQMYGNQLVFPYLQMTEEAGPLPEKQPIS